MGSHLTGCCQGVLGCRQFSLKNQKSPSNSLEAQQVVPEENPMRSKITIFLHTCWLQYQSCRRPPLCPHHWAQWPPHQARDQTQSRARQTPAQWNSWQWSQRKGWKWKVKGDDNVNLLSESLTKSLKEEIAFETNRWHGLLLCKKVSKRNFLGLYIYSIHDRIAGVLTNQDYMPCPFFFLSEEGSWENTSSTSNWFLSSKRIILQSWSTTWFHLQANPPHFHYLPPQATGWKPCTCFSSCPSPPCPPPPPPSSQ